MGKQLICLLLQGDDVELKIVTTNIYAVVKFILTVYIFAQ